MQKKETKEEKIKVEIPKRFLWVVNYHLKQYINNKNGEAIFNFKDGNVCNIKELNGYTLIYPEK